MFVAERFLSKLLSIHGKHSVSTDGGTWYPQACRFLELDHHIHSPFEKSIIKRTIQYIKDRTESFDDYFPSVTEKKNVIFFMLKIGLLFATMYNKGILNT